MQRIYDYFRPFSYHDYTPPVDSTEECVICHDPLSEGLNGTVAHNDLNPRVEARQEHLHPVHKECLEQWILEPTRQSTLKGRILCVSCKQGIDFRSIFPIPMIIPLITVPEMTETLKRMVLKTLITAATIPTIATAVMICNSLLNDKLLPKFIYPLIEKGIIQSVGELAQGSSGFSLVIATVGGPPMAALTWKLTGGLSEELKETAETIIAVVLASGVLGIVANLMLTDLES